MAKAYSYLRFSRPEQMKGDSQRRQVTRSQEWAARNKVPLDESLNLRDLGVSAFRGKNARVGALALFLEAIQTGRVKAGDFLILENLDRLSREEVFDNALPLVQGIIKKGVCIVTLDPERIYSPTTVREIGPLLEMLLAMYLANEESRKKSERLSQAWKTKRVGAGAKKLTSIAPMWLKLSDDRKTFGLIPERVEVVQRIFRMARDGAGSMVIVKRLNADQVPTFGKGKRKADFWQRSYVKKILANRAVLGEYQPNQMRDGKRVPAGAPISGYFPAVIDEAEFYAAQKGRRERKGRGGRNGQRVTNLFTGLLRDARDGSTMHTVDKGEGLQLVSSAARAGQKGAVYLSFPYEPFEQSLLIWGHDLKLGDVLPRKATDLDAELLKTEGRLADLEARIAKVKARLQTDPDIDVLLETAVALEGERTETKAKLERLKGEQATPEADAVDGLKAVLQAVKQAKGEALLELRLKLRQLLSRVIDGIQLLVVQVNRDRVALADIKLKNGMRRQVTIHPPGRRVTLPKGLADRDIRNWKKWPEAMRQSHFKTTTDEARTMMDLEKAGHSRTAIAERLSVSVSQVSRTLIRCNCRKRVRVVNRG